jgi:GT2 family glycosyltransferase
VAEGYDWIYWGDDDDPPLFHDTFEKLLNACKVNPEKIGILGAVGHHFLKRSGEIKRMPEVELQHAIDSKLEFIPVDSVAGNQSMIVNAEVVRKGVLPNEALFFGFEELDFCLKVKEAGFEIMVSTELFVRSRQAHQRVGYRLPFYIPSELNKLHRQYYSTRNLLLILKRNGLYIPFLYQIVKAIGKLIYGFRFGLVYGKVNFKMISRGLFDGIINRRGRSL